MKLACLILLFHAAVVWGAEDSARVLVRVNGTPITAGDVEFAATTEQVKPEERARRAPELLEKLIDRQLVRGFLVKRKIEAPADDVEFQMQRVEAAIKRQGDDPAKLLPKLGLTPERLKVELGLPLAWQVYVRQTVTLPQTKEYFEQHRAELDGTQLRARQIFLKLSAEASDADVAAKTAKLKDVRSQISSGKLTFADAAKQFSESPSREQGGDVGRFGFRGKLPVPVVRAAFALKVDEISEPVVSTFGVHLLQVTERQPGDLSLEDVRPEIVERLSEQLWTDTIERERKTAKIERSQ